VKFKYVEYSLEPHDNILAGFLLRCSVKHKTMMRERRSSSASIKLFEIYDMTLLSPLKTCWQFVSEGV